MLNGKDSLKYNDTLNAQLSTLRISITYLNLFYDIDIQILMFTIPIKTYNHR